MVRRAIVDTATRQRTAESVITIVDDDKDTSQIALTFDPPEVSQEAGPTTITVTATLNGETVTKKNLSFPLVVVGTEGANALAAANVPNDADGDDLTQGVRDTDYGITGLGTITIPKKKVTGKATFTIDPSKGPRWVGIGTTVATALRYDANGQGSR